MMMLQIRKAIFLISVLLLSQLVLAQQRKPLNLEVVCPDTIRAGDTLDFVVNLDIQQDWYLYGPELINKRQGMEPMKLDFQPLSDGLELVGEISYPTRVQKGAFSVLIGNGNRLVRRIAVNEAFSGSSVSIRGNIVYQMCNNEQCLPPMTDKFFKTIFVIDRPVSKSAADVAWEELEKSTTLFSNKSDRAQYLELKPLDMRRYDDKIYRHRAKLAYEFWRAYPDDVRRGLATVLFLSADPWFIAKEGNEALDSLTTWKAVKDRRAFMRKVISDNEAQQEWVRNGDKMVLEALDSPDSTAVAKEAVAFLPFARDFRAAARYYGFLPADSAESHYWNAISETYWEPFYERFEDHARTYSDNPILALRAKDFLSALKARAPAIAEQYWRKLQSLSWHGDTLPSGIVALREAADEQLFALDVESGDVPVEMSFTALDGTPFNLADLRGKTVLIDFWATWCKPCIAELPHVKALYDRYRDQGFEVVGVCLDDEAARNRATDILSQHGANWPQRFEGAGFGNDAYRQLYGIKSLPTVWLLDKDGRIVDRNARGEKLEKMLREELGKSG